MRLLLLSFLVACSCNVVSAFVAPSTPATLKNRFEGQQLYAATTQAERDLIKYQRLIRDCKSFRELKRLQERGAFRYDGPNVSYYFSQVARFIKKGPQNARVKRSNIHLKPFVDKLLRFSSDITAPKDLAAIAHAIGKISFYTQTTIYESEKAWGILEKNILKASQTEGAFTTRQAANIVWALAKLNMKNEKILGAMEAQLLSNIDEINSQGVANVAWACAKLGHSAPKLYEALAAQTMEKLDNFNNHEMENVKWGFEKAGQSAPELIAAIDKTLEAKKGETLNFQNRRRAAIAEKERLDRIAEEDGGIYMPWKKR